MRNPQIRNLKLKNNGIVLAKLWQCLFGNEQRYDQSIKGALISNGIVHEKVLEVIKNYIIEE